MVCVLSSSIEVHALSLFALARPQSRLECSAQVLQATISASIETLVNY